MRALVEVYGTQNTRPSGRSTPPTNALLPGYVPLGVVTPSPHGPYAVAIMFCSCDCIVAQFPPVCRLTGVQGGKPVELFQRLPSLARYWSSMENRPLER